MKKLYFFGKIIFILFVLPSCDCKMQPVKKDFAGTKFVVIGEVIKLLDSKVEKSDYIAIHTKENDSWAESHSYKVKLKIIECFKGKIAKGKIIEIDSDFSNCSIYYESSKKYLLFLDKKGNTYFQKHCTHSSEISEATESIEKIKLLKKE